MNTQTELSLDSLASPYINQLYSVNDAMELLRMSRTDFFRFRKNRMIQTLPGRRLHGDDIVREFERDRGRSTEGPFPSLTEYTKKLLKLDEVGTVFQLSETTLYKLRVRHRVPYLPGRQLHHDDIVAALEAERRGELPLGLPVTVRVVLRRK